MKSFAICLFVLLSFSFFNICTSVRKQSDNNNMTDGNSSLHDIPTSTNSSSEVKSNVNFSNIPNYNQIYEDRNGNGNGNVIKLTEKNFVVIRGPIDGSNSAKVVNELLSKQRESELYIYLITNGGSVISGMEIVRTLKSLSENKVSIKCIADTALSMGFVIFQYCPVRYVTLTSVLMQHQLSLGVRGPLYQINNYLDFIQSVEDEVDRHQANRIGLAVPEFRSKIAHDWWLFGENIVKNKVADGMINVICDFEPSLITETVQTIFGDVDLTYSSCPLARDPLQISFKDNIPSEDKEKVISLFDSSKYISDRLSVNTKSV